MSESPLSVGLDGIRLKHSVRSGSLRVALDGDQLFPVTRFAKGAFVRWPGGLAARVRALGRTEIALVDGQGAPVVSVHHNFGGAESWRRPTDSIGRPLTLNKWGWWGLNLQDRDPEERRRALEDLGEVLGELSSMGRPAWIAGGTLLGAVRDGALIDYDDDVDVAYLASSGNPAEVASESFAIERHLEERGWESRRFSGAHFQLRGADLVDGREPVHVDVFSAFFRGGTLNQPFHLRGRFNFQDLLPLGMVTLEGSPFPSPRSPDRWLALNYGGNWALPDPGHVLRTPRLTQMRFSAWFGDFQPQLEFWIDYHDRVANDHPVASESVRWLADRLEPGTPVIELGCGSGVDARYLAGRGFPVLAVDYVTCQPAPLGIPAEGASFARANLADSRDVWNLLRAASRHPGLVHVHSRNLVERLEPTARRSFLHLLRALPPGSTYSVTFRSSGTGDPTDPTTWFIDEVGQRSLALPGMALEAVQKEAGGEITLLWSGAGHRGKLGPYARIPHRASRLKTDVVWQLRRPLRVAALRHAAEAAQGRNPVAPAYLGASQSEDYLDVGLDSGQAPPRKAAW